VVGGIEIEEGLAAGGGNPRAADEVVVDGMAHKPLMK
jgi:hypothetical protein